MEDIEQQNHIVPGAPNRPSSKLPARCSTISSIPSLAAKLRAPANASGNSITVERMGGCFLQMAAPNNPCEPATSNRLL